VGVWGRDPEKAAATATELGVPRFDDYDELLDAVEAVAFAVPPQVQGELALRAAERGKHLLLDKPVATTVEAAQRLVAAVEASGVASVVFFTDRYSPEVRSWLAELEGSVGWRGGWSRWFSAHYEPDNPFRDSPWRHRHGALWDVGPHLLAMLTAALGPVTGIRAVAGEDDLSHLVMRHRSGATSTASVTHMAPPAATGYDCTVWGEAGVSSVPPRDDAIAVPALALAATELVAAAASGTPHPMDVRFGARVVELLAEAESQLGR
jgi:predicted dehydrogenase